MKNDIGTYHNDKLTDFGLFCKVHWNYKTKNLKFNILKFVWKLLDSLKKLSQKMEQFFANIQVNVSDKLTKIYLNFEKPTIREDFEDYIFERYGYKK